MKPFTINPDSSRCKRMIIVAEINKLRKIEHARPVETKIYREMRKLHALWFKGQFQDEIRA
jgi:hypothetical protein